MRQSCLLMRARDGAPLHTHALFCSCLLTVCVDGRWDEDDETALARAIRASLGQEDVGPEVLLREEQDNAYEESLREDLRESPFCAAVRVAVGHLTVDDIGREKATSRGR